jgi:hypothetical protein
VLDQQPGPCTQDERQGGNEKRRHHGVDVIDGRTTDPLRISETRYYNGAHGRTRSEVP